MSNIITKNQARQAADVLEPHGNVDYCHGFRSALQAVVVNINHSDGLPADLHRAARNAVNEFYLMYPAAKTQLPRTAKQSLEQYIIRHVMREIEN